MAKKLSIGSWAYAFGPYEDNPVPFDDVVKRLSELDLMALRLGRLNHTSILTTTR